MFRFAHPELLYLLLLVPLLIALFIYSNYRRGRALRRYGNPEVMTQLMPDASRTKIRIKFWLQLIALTLLIFAIATPQFGSKLETVKKQGIEVVVALDVSNSMLAEDISPSRLEKAKMMLSRLIEALRNDKIGLIVFAGDAYTQLPITSDFVSAKMFLSSITPDMVATQGTAIGKALALAERSFTPSTESSKVIILITDGENHEDNGVEIAAEIAKKGIKVNVIGIGSTQGVPIPMSKTDASLRKDREGNVVITKLNELDAQQIATAGGGVYVRADNTNNALKVITKELDSLNKTELESRVFTEYDEQFQPIAWVVLLLLLLDIFILDRKNSLFRKINLFNS